MNNGFDSEARARSCAFSFDEGFRQACEAHYGGQRREGGVESRCKMWLPGGLEGMRVLDIGCRKGKGAYKLAEAVGPHGFVLGVDWSLEFVERAREGTAAAARKCGIASLPLGFAVAYPELLCEAGLKAQDFDVAVANSVLNASFRLESALREIARTLAPGGLFYFATVLAREPLSIEARRQAASMGDVVGSSLSWEELRSVLEDAGFVNVSCEDEGSLEADGMVLSGFRQAVVSAWTR